MKPYAILFLAGMRVVYIDTKDEAKNQVADATVRNFAFLLFKYNETAGCYAPVEPKIL